LYQKFKIGVPACLVVSRHSYGVRLKNRRR
jgi:hypothetical protein